MMKTISVAINVMAEALRQNRKRFLGCVYNSGTNTCSCLMKTARMMSGRLGTMFASAELQRPVCTTHCSMKAAFQQSVLPFDCAVHAADHFLQNYLTAFLLSNQVISTVACLIRSFVGGGFPDMMKVKAEGRLQRTRVAFFTWTGLQIATIPFLVASLLVVFFDYVSATSMLGHCMVRVGGASVLHLVVSTGFFLQPAVTTKIFALNLTLISVFTGVRGNEFASVKFGSTMKLFFGSQFLLAGFLPLVYSMFSGSFILSIFMTLPVFVITFLVIPLMKMCIEFLDKFFNNDRQTGAVFWLGN